MEVTEQFFVDKHGRLITALRIMHTCLRKSRRTAALNRTRNAVTRYESKLRMALAAWQRKTRSLLASRLDELRTPAGADRLPWDKVEDEGKRLLLPLLEAAYAHSWRLAGKLRKQDEDEERADVIGVRAKQYAAKKGSERIVEITRQQRAAVRAIILQSIDAGFGIAQTARMLREIVGLNARLAAAVGNYYTRMLERGVADDVANKRLARYANKLLTYRTKTIARTEGLNALRVGTVESFREMEVERVEWIADADSCDVCQGYDGKTYTLDEVQAILNPHPNCECTIVMAQPGAEKSAERQPRPKPAGTTKQDAAYAFYGD